MSAARDEHLDPGPHAPDGPARTVDAAALAATLRGLGEGATESLLKPSLQRVIDACDDVFGVDGSGLMLADDRGDLRYVVASDGPGRVLEHAQMETSQGPCVDAFLASDVVSTRDVTTDGRWPVLAEILAPLPVRAVVGLPVRLSGVDVGTLNLYRATPEDWAQDVRNALTRFGRLAEHLMATAVAADRAGELATQLTYALEYRAPIERAVGFLMARQGLSQPEAFNLLRSSARSTRRRIGDVAQRLLQTGSLSTEETG